MKKLNKSLSFLLFILICVKMYSTIINVPDEQTTIQQGINFATNGDTVLVQPGTYVEQINFNGKNITVASLYLTTNDIHYIYQTEIEGDSYGTLVTFENGEISDATLIGFTIKNGYANNGGGIKCVSSNPTLSNLVITNNRGGITIYSGGAGIHCENSNPTISNSLISNNHSNQYAGGIYCNLSNPILNQVIFENNTANGDGSAIYCKESNPTLINLTIADNIAGGGGGGIYCFRNSNPVLQNTILWNNSPEEICFSGSNAQNSVTISYSDIKNGETGINTNSNGTVFYGIGNIEDNPDFVLNDNFNISLNSPCLNIGNPDLDSDNITWENDSDDQDPDDTRMDIGANFIYDYQFDFFTNDNFGCIDFDVNFTSNISGYVYDKLWDFENDGIFDSTVDNPLHTYTQAGIYDVKLKVFLNLWHTYSDSIIKPNLIVVQSSQLPPPQNVTISFMNNDANLEWEPVENATFYLIYGSPDWNGIYEFVDFTESPITNYTHEGIGLLKDKFFYKIIAYDGSWDELKKLLEKKYMNKFLNYR